MKRKTESKKGFPTIGEVTKFIIEAFDFYEFVTDSKSRSSLIKEIKRFSDEKDFDMDRAQHFIDSVIDKSFGNLIQNKVFFIDLKDNIMSFLKDYKTIVLNVNVSFVEREKILKTLITYYFVFKFAWLVQNLQKSETGLIFPKTKLWWLPDEDEENKMTSPISNVLDWWADQTDCDSLYKLCQKIMKEKYKDRLENDKSFYESEKILLFYQKYNRWRKNDHLPSSYSIGELSGIDLGLTFKDQIPENSLKFNLFIARGIQYCINILEELFGINDTFIIIKNIKRYINSDCIDTDINEFIEHIWKRIEEVKEENSKELKSNIILINNILGNKYTSIVTEKNENDELKAKEVLFTLSKTEELNNSYIVELQRARFYALHTDEKVRKEALKHYENAFENAKYQAGIDLKPILKEALVLSARTDNLNLFKKLYKWANFYEIFHEPYEEVKDYILDHLSSQYYAVFDPKAFYKTDIATYEKLKNKKLNGFIIDNDLIDNFKVDRRYPDRKIKGIGKYPLTQMMIAASFEKVDELKELINLKADPNIVAADGSTALIRAIQLKPSEIISEKQLECCKLLLNLDIKPSINSRTNKERKTALMCAIESGNIGLVKLVLKHGADINQKCSENCKDGLTPLYYTLKLIGSARKWERDNNSLKGTYEDKLKAMKLNNIPRYFSKDIFDSELAKRVELLESDRHFNGISDLVAAYLMSKRIEKLDSYYKIIDILLERKPDTNILHDHKFTALLYSAEIGEIDIAEKLIKNGAKLKNLISNNGSIIELALGYGNYGFAEYLLDNHPDEMSELINVSYKHIHFNKNFTVLYPLFTADLTNKETYDIVKRIVRKIFDLGFNKENKEAGEITIYDLAKEKKNELLAEILQEFYHI